MIELRAGRLRCELLPELGGAIAGLWLDELPVLRSTPAAALASARQAGCIPLVPFSNRVGHASVQWEGTVLPLIRHPGDAPHTILGVGAHRPWEVLDNDETTAMLACEHRRDAAWPFAFDCSHTLRLRADALELTLALTNQSGQVAPASLGWRPALARRPGARVAFQAAGLWQPGPDHLPLFRTASQGLAADAGTLAAEACYDGWNGLAELADANLRVRIRSDLKRLLVLADPAQDAIVLAPVSHAPNAVHLHAAGSPAGDLGLALLQPGETVLAQMTIEVEGQP